MDEQIRQEKLSRLANVFSPTAPIISSNLFFGRLDHLNQILEAAKERGQHVVLYGERGVGKTSLANIIESRFSKVLIAKVTCNRNETYDNIWRKILKKISFIQKSTGIGFEVVESEKKVQLDLFLDGRNEVKPDDIADIFEYVKNPIIFIFDEFDSMQSPQIRTRFTDTIKALSDNASNVTIIIVGIAESVTELIGEHPSIERCLKQVKLPRMSDAELGEIIDNGLRVLEMSVHPLIRSKIIRFSQGFPHYTHLLAKYAGKIAIESGASVIDDIHFDAAVSDAIDNVQESVRSDFQKAILTSKERSMFENVIYACALASGDEYGTFRALDLALPLQKLTGKPVGLNAYIYNLGKLCQEERGAIIQKIGQVKRYRYRFRNPLLKAFVTLRLYQKGSIS
ncbi:MAG: ATP-binding protein [candidate division Zixibacteria bacterium]|nr:ATP-binding protein [candidate division Zixibacteria bacterium]